MVNTFRNRVLRGGHGRRRTFMRRFAREEKGATAVEFALIALPFLALLFAIMETALVFFAGQALETALADSARKIMTGEAAKWDVAKFKEEVCGRIYGLFDCNKIQVNVQAYSAFGSADMKRPVDENGNIITGFNPGKAGDVVIARLMYDWPVYVPLANFTDTDRPAGKRLLISTAAFRNEPYSN